MLNVKACQSFNKVIKDLINYTGNKFRFPGNMLEYPEFVPQCYSYKKRNIGHMWIPYLANILYKRIINIRIPNSL